ncbi:hypothetical protein [Botrimarina sp.]|uniref:hypothetical protein n=1 Tax=Botrimarina sp. TaxID=2795802 RepID=UPI0032EC4913
MSWRPRPTRLAPARNAVAATALVCLAATTASAFEGWNGQRRLSHQRPNDLFYNHYVGPGPSGTTAQQYVSPVPVPPQMGHTYTTYQPLMPHEYMYKHHRSYCTYRPGAGWTRTKVRYHTGGTLLHHASFGLWDDVPLGFFRNIDFMSHIDHLQKPDLY